MDAVQTDDLSLTLTLTVFRSTRPSEDACYVKVEGCPRILFVTQYPDDQPEGAGGEYRVRALEIF